MAKKQYKKREAPKIRVVHEGVVDKRTDAEREADRIWAEKGIVSYLVKYLTEWYKIPENRHWFEEWYRKTYGKEYVWRTPREILIEEGYISASE